MKIHIKELQTTKSKKYLLNILLIDPDILKLLGSNNFADVESD